MNECSEETLAQEMVEIQKLKESDRRTNKSVTVSDLSKLIKFTFAK